MTLRMIDTHCHLENEAFTTDLETVIQKAADKGIHIITSAINKNSWSKCCEIASIHDNVYCSIGLDPMQYEDYTLAIDWIKDHSSKIIAIGETGLDHFIIRNHEQRDEQELAFRSLIALSIEIKHPIQVHSRSAGKKALEVLESCNAADVHLHAFDGRASLARIASRDLGYYFSIPTSVVRSPQKQKLVKAIDIERLLLETDSPVLGAEKGERNEPANLDIALQEVALILHRDEEELREIVLENTLRLYKGIKSL